jgi:HEPN domain-containing protein
MSGVLEPEKDLGKWIEKAESDWHCIAALQKELEPDIHEAVCFHAQQCAEKYFKALLVSKDKNFPKTHDIRLLLQLAKECGSDYPDWGEAIALNRCTVEARYPGDWEQFTKTEVEESVKAAANARNWVRSLLELDG